MSMPAVARGRVFMAYPDTREDHAHYLACFDLTNGQRLWRSRIPGEIITAPVLEADAVYFATLGGTLMCFGQESGELRWQDENNATSSPVVVDGHCYFSQRKQAEHKKQTEAESREDARALQEMWQMEQCAIREAVHGAETRGYASTTRKADYLDHAKRVRGSPRRRAMAQHDAAVGFASAKGSSKMHQAVHNLGHGTVAGVWAYQGSKPFFWDGRLYSSLGDTLHCVDARSDAVIWRRTLHDDGSEELVDSVVTPPVLVNAKVFVANAAGNVFALSAQTGDVLWQDDVKRPVDFQLAVMQGRVYVPTRNGQLFCLETGDAQDDGWAMWGATPEHNGLIGSSIV
jgi:outer membrane protein assembly factor BamB